MELYIILSTLVIFLSLQVYGVFKNKNLEKFFKLSFYYSIFVVFIAWFGISFLQIKAWQSMGSPAMYLAPPYESFIYAFEYHFHRFLLYYLIALVVALIFLIYTKRLNKKSGELFFEKEEPYIAAISILAMGATGLTFSWIYYLLAIFVIPVFISLIKKIFIDEIERFPLRFLWLPFAILVILVNILL
ncbi:MAG: hypothetical protein WDZ80_01135 [Candidatus Paceibacterota bacterium]